MTSTPVATPIHRGRGSRIEWWPGFGGVGLMHSLDMPFSRTPAAVGMNSSHISMVFAIKNRRGRAEIYSGRVDTVRTCSARRSSPVEAFTLGRRTAFGDSRPIAVPVTGLAPIACFLRLKAR
jgi:hypothetical protein